MAGELQIYAAQQNWRSQVRARLGGADNSQGAAISLSVSATTGFAFLPNCSGVPTGIPADQPVGLSAVVIDATNYKLCWFVGGAWRTTP